MVRKHGQVIHVPQLFYIINPFLLTYTHLNVDLKVTPQIILGSVFLLVLVKFFASILNQKRLELVTFFDHKPQTGFLVNNGTADHVFGR